MTSQQLLTYFSEKRFVRELRTRSKDGVLKEMTELLARERVQTVYMQPTIQEDIPARDKVGRVIFNEDISRDRPHRLDLFKSNVFHVPRCRQKLPGQLPVRGAQTVNPSVVAPEKHAPSVNGGGRVYACAGHKTP